MSTALYALLGVIIGSGASVGFQAWERRKASRDRSAKTSRRVTVAILDATWERLSLVAIPLSGSRPTTSDVFKNWASARSRFIESEIKDADLLTSWLELVLTDRENADDMTWHDASLVHGRISSTLFEARRGDQDTWDRLREERDRLVDKYWVNRYELGDDFV